MPLLFAILFFVCPLDAQEEIPAMIHGIYGHPGPLWEQELRLDEMGINAIFVHSGALDTATISRARRENCRVFAEFATLNGDYGNYVAEHPEAHPIDANGEKVARATWFMGACPTDPGFRSYRMDALRSFLTEHEVDGVWMDYLHWHAQFEDPYPLFFKTCFNGSCLHGFTAATGIEPIGEDTAAKAEWILLNAPREWEDWRVSVLVDWAREFHSIVKEIRPQALVGNYQAAWKDEDFWGARRRCLGLDFDALAPYVDVFSPMPYHGRSDMPTSYVRDYVEYFSQRHTVYTEKGRYPRLWPIVQAYDEPRISGAELEQVLEYALAAKSSGAMMFTSGSVAADPDKIAAVRRVYTRKR
jgi:hypothetical protein